ncbi:MAG: hypothetical protein IJP17_04155 [Clostridia bacterium]|nr:hypothetical protein [Clostridia bacterium]
MEDELKKIGIIAEKIEISMATEADGSISIGQVTVTVSKEDAEKGLQIKLTLEESLGLAAEVVT